MKDMKFMKDNLPTQASICARMIPKIASGRIFSICHRQIEIFMTFMLFMVNLIGVKVF
jgi:hypothetical protein